MTAEQSTAPVPPTDDFARWALELAKTTVENMRTLFTLKVHVPPSVPELAGAGDSADFATALEQIRAFRAEVFYDDGRRPSFRGADGVFRDVEDIDEYACHIVCRDPAGDVIGCMRVARADLLRSSAVAEHLGEERSEKEIRDLGLEKSQVMEVGRLAVASDQRRRGVARALLMTSHVLACRLGCLVMWGTAGQGDGQDKYLSKFSSGVLADSSATVAKYEDEACVVIHDHRLTLPFIHDALDLVEVEVFGPTEPAVRLDGSPDDIVARRYEPPLAPARRSFDEDAAILRLRGSDDEDLFRLFMIRFCAHGVRMTEQVSSWISRAGERCAELGRTELGAALKAHARSEAGHEKMMESDARLMCGEWNRGHSARIDPDALLESAPLYATRKYVELHEEVIAGSRPWCQLAVEFEIERLSLVLGPNLLAKCVSVLTDDSYSFLAEHVELDKGHTAFNERQLAGLLREDDADLVALVETGRRALHTYREFIAECVELAEADLARLASA